MDLDDTNVRQANNKVNYYRWCQNKDHNDTQHKQNCHYDEWRYAEWHNAECCLALKGAPLWLALAPSLSQTIDKGKSFLQEKNTLAYYTNM